MRPFAHARTDAYTTDNLPMQVHMPLIAVILVAAGRGTRAGGDVPKQYRLVAGKPVVTHALQAFLEGPNVGLIQPVIHGDDAALFAYAANKAEADGRVLPPVTGGVTRQASVRAGLEALAQLSTPPALVLIHDAARPFVSASLIERAIAAAAEHGVAIPAIPVTDTVKEVDADGLVLSTPDRASLRAVQTPQAFRFELIRDAHRRAADARRDDFTDDSALAEWADYPVRVFAGEIGNVKLTHPEDFMAADQRLKAQLIPRVGFGYDVHAFTDGDHIWLGGVRIAHERGVLAHSDGDVVLHALTDALLGTLAEGDIGTHFPPSDPQWKDAASDQFLAHAARLVRTRGGIIDHLDVTIVCEAPKVGPYREAMRAAIARAAGVAESAVSIKATTSERLGFTGRREGLAAQAVASVRLPLGGDDHA
jgi:2-C-methyl-D-erythritol 4-phosphate cytidylyltransferase/2-C-methyl-D-erythritol 2,4-cyclodiphosphate synthase